MAAPVVVGLSGGVDSAVAAARLKAEGRDVVGVFMVNWEEAGADGVCTAADDYDSARAVCQALDIPYYTMNFSRDYKERVFSDFLRELSLGRTPNPDVLCNREIKFSAFLDAAKSLGASALATGHYARTRLIDGHVRLLRGADPDKDQSYFLYMLNEDALAFTLFPVGELTKTRVRELARSLDLPNAERRGSTGICFIGERNFNRFVSQYLEGAPGDIVTPGGRVLGRHDGLIHYTLGQRRGIRLGGGSGDGRPWFVAEKRTADNALVVVQGHDAPELFSRALTASQTHFIAGAPPADVFSCVCKIRYRQPDQPARVFVSGGACRVEFESPQRAVTPGQSVVFYDGEVCLGGAIIDAGAR